MNSFFKKALPHLIAVGIFLVVAVVYCQPAFQGKVVDQHDIQGWKGMAQQSFEFKEKYGHMPYWINSMFCGMPGYQTAFEPPIAVSVVTLHNLFTLLLPKPVSFFFLACVMTYFMLMVLRLNPWVGVLGAIAYAYSTFDPIIIAVGHDTQMICIAYAPAVIGSLLLILRKQYFTGTVLLALFTALMLTFNHMQIVYYTLITALCISLAFAIDHLRAGAWKQVAISGALALLAGGIALGVNTVNIWPTNELVKETMRGGRSELSDTAHANNKTKGGLDKSYAFNFNYGIAETFTLLVPGIYGGGSGASQLEAGGSKLAEKLAEVGVPEESGVKLANQYAYWGNQPGTSGPVYLGAVICFLFIAAMVFVRGWLKWSIAAACLFGIILAWGKNLESVNYFLYDHLPLYKKFRAITMALVIPQLGFVVMACLAVQEMLFGNIQKELLWKRFRLTCSIALGIFALLAIMYVSFSYSGQQDAVIRQNFASNMLQQAQGQQPTPQLQQQANDFATSMMKGIEDDRQSLFGKDLLRSLMFVLLAAGTIYLFIKNQINAVIALYALALLSTIDIMAVGKRYLNDKSFVEPEEFESVFTPTAADNQIKADPDKYFRVYDLTAAQGPFNDSRASYFHNSVGGYNPAKLALYQDIIERQLSAGNMQVFNMLNTKYFIVANEATRQPEAQLNTKALGNAWFVKGIRYARNADEEMSILNTLNTRDSAVVDVRYRQVASAQPLSDSAASITLAENLNDRISYKSNASTPQFAVFSEVYYPYGWDAYIDGKKTDYCRVNYVLRGMPVPAGNHIIEFRFEPRSVIMGTTITTWFSILIYVLLLAALVLEIRKRKTAEVIVKKL